MPPSETGVLSVPLSFSNNFWGRDDAGVDPLLTRMQNSKTTCDELKSFYKARAELEEDYARKLFALCRKPLGSVEQGTLRASLDVARGETETMGKQHALIAQQMKSECEEPLGAFAGGMKERRKIVQTGIEKLLKTKQAQTAQVNKCRDRYEQDALRIKGYLAQGHMVMGQEERKNKAKLEKTQINMATNSQDYETAVKVLEETTGRWNKEWKAACDKFQDLEEERLDFTKSSLWAFANIASTVCVSDDASCEKVRLALENCEVEKDITNFIKTCGTGQEIPDPPRYINFCRGDLDTASEVSEDDNYSVAQFSRTMNPAFRSSSPTHTQAESMTERDVSEEPRHVEERHVSTSTGPNSGRPAPLNVRIQGPNVPPEYSPSRHGEIPEVPHNEYPTEGMTMYCRKDEPPRSMARSDLSSSTRPPSRDSQSEYSNPSSYTSAEPLSGKNSPTKQPPINGVGMPGMTGPPPEKTIEKRRSGFFSNSPFKSNSPFRRKSKKEIEHPASRDAWTPGATRSDNSAQSSPAKAPRIQAPFNRNAGMSAPEGEEPADPRASFQLNIGPNVLDVASPDSASHQSTPRASMANRRGPFNAPPLTSNNGDHDPIAQALANLKQSSGGIDMSKRASLRQPVDSYHRVKTPAPDQGPSSRPNIINARGQDILAAQRGTPPPAYEGGRPQTALGVPQPAFTSKEMRSRTENWGMGSSVSAPVGRPGSSMGMNRPASRDGRRSPGPSAIVPRAASPQPQYHNMRSRSPAPPINPDMRSHSPAPSMNPNMRSHSPAPHMNMNMRLNAQNQQGAGQNGSGRSRQAMMNTAVRPRPTSSYGGQYQEPSYDGRSRGADPNLRRERSKSVAGPGVMSGAPPQSQSQYRSASPNPYGGSRPRAGTASASSQHMRQNSGMEMQLASSDVARYDSGAPAPGAASNSVFYARAMYGYTAAIPEELSFTKGDILAVLRLQDDGWWEAEVNRSIKTGGPGPGGVGLVPSNYLQRC